MRGAVVKNKKTAKREREQRRWKKKYDRAARRYGRSKDGSRKEARASKAMDRAWEKLEIVWLNYGR